MIVFWVTAGIVLIALGLFVFSQGGQNIGPAIATLGVVILLILIVSPARADGALGSDSWAWRAVGTLVPARKQALHHSFHTLNPEAGD